LRGGRVGIEGAVARAKHGAVRTAGANGVSDEDRSKPRKPSRLGLWSGSCRSAIYKQKQSHMVERLKASQVFTATPPITHKRPIATH